MVYFPTAFMTVMVALLFGGAFAAPVPTPEVGNSIRVPAAHLHPGNMESVLPRAFKDLFIPKKQATAKKDSDDAAGASLNALNAWQAVKHATPMFSQRDPPVFSPLYNTAVEAAIHHKAAAADRRQQATLHAKKMPWSRPNAGRSSAESKAITEMANASAKTASDHLFRLTGKPWKP